MTKRQRGNNALRLHVPFGAQESVKTVILKMIVEPFGLAHYPFAGETYTLGNRSTAIVSSGAAYLDAVEV